MRNLISVICPVTNEPPVLVRKTWDSVLNQTHKNVELVIIEDGVEEDSLLKLVDEFEKRDRVVVGRRERRDKRKNRLRTCSESYNLGTKLSSGNWIAHNASDNHFEPDWAERLVGFIAGREDEINGVCTNWVKHNYDGSTEVVDMTERYDWSKPTLENYVRIESLGGWIYKADWCGKIEWDARFPRKQTREFHIRLFKTGNIVHYPKFLWHFEQWEPDQQKNYASVHWRMLADLKNDIHDAGNLMFGMQLSRRTGDPNLYYAAISAYHEFMTDPKWRKEYERSRFKAEMERVMDKYTEEATEK